MKILKDNMRVTCSLKSCILQPQSEIAKVRAFLIEEGFLIIAEDMVCEDGKYYPMMRVGLVGFGRQESAMADNLAEVKKRVEEVPPVLSDISKDNAVKMRRIEDTYGPYLLKKSHPVLKQYLLWQKENLDNIRGNLVSQRQPTPRQQYRIAELDEALSDIVYCLYNFY